MDQMKHKAHLENGIANPRVKQDFRSFLQLPHKARRITAGEFQGVPSPPLPAVASSLPVFNMHRQSLSSPISKLHGGSAIAVAKEDAITAEDLKRRDSFSSSSLIGEYDDEDSKVAKLHRLSISPRSPPKPEKFIHLIPVLTLLCFLILYLCSHNPSQSDLAQFNGFNRLPNRIAADSTELIGGINELQKGDVLAIRSLRNLQEIDKRSSKSRYGRKLGDF